MFSVAYKARTLVQKEVQDEFQRGTGKFPLCRRYVDLLPELTHFVNRLL